MRPFAALACLGLLALVVGCGEQTPGGRGFAAPAERRATPTPDEPNEALPLAPPEARGATPPPRNIELDPQRGALSGG